MFFLLLIVVAYACADLGCGSIDVTNDYSYIRFTINGTHDWNHVIDVPAFTEGIVNIRSQKYAILNVRNHEMICVDFLIRTCNPEFNVIELPMR